MSKTTIPYASHYATSHASKGFWPAAILCATGFGLAVLAVCVLVGALTITRTEPSPFLPNAELARRAAEEVVVVRVLYAMAALFVVGATTLTVMGVRRL